MTVWVVTKSWIPNTEIEKLKSWGGFQEIVGVYSTDERARAMQEELINQNSADMLYFDCDPIDVFVEEWEVE